MSEYTVDPALAALLGVSTEEEGRRLAQVRSGLRERFVSPRRRANRSERTLEKEMLQAHRDEVAYLLLLEARRMFEDSDAGRSASPYHTVRIKEQFPLAEQELTARKALTISSSIGASPLGRRYDSCYASAAASLSSAETVSAHLYAAMALLELPSWLEAKRHIDRAIEIAPSFVLWSCAIEKKAIFESRQGNIRAALDLARKPSQVSDPIPALPLYRLWYALRLGDARAIESAREAVDALIPPDHPALILFLKARSRGPGKARGHKLPALNARGGDAPSDKITNAFKSQIAD